MKTTRILIIMKGSLKKYLVCAAIIIIATALATAMLYALLHSQPLKGKSILLDPGHGGKDYGVSSYDGILEKNINLQVSQTLAKQLQKHGSQVTFTRTQDRSPAAAVQAEDADKANLQARVQVFNSGKYDLFLSIHTNFSTSSRDMGPMVLYSSQVPRSKLLAVCLQKRLNRHTRELLQATREYNPLRSEYYILRNADITGVMVEAGFLSNTEERKLLLREGYRRNLARAITAGIEDYYRAIARDPDSHLTLEDVEDVPIRMNSNSRMVQEPAGLP